jgi:hypothetical protein
LNSEVQEKGGAKRCEQTDVLFTGARERRMQAEREEVESEQGL